MSELDEWAEREVKRTEGENRMHMLIAAAEALKAAANADFITVYLRIIEIRMRSCIMLGRDPKLTPDEEAFMAMLEEAEKDVGDGRLG